MRSLYFALLVGALVAFTGCNNSTPGGATPSGKDHKPVTGNADKTFTFSLPTGGVTLKQGEAKDATFGISRGKNFEDDVTLTFDGLPKGVTADPASPVIKHSDKEVKVNFKAADDATVGKATVHVEGKPATGDTAKGDFTMTVDKK